MSAKAVSLSRFILSYEHGHREDAAELAVLLNQVAYAGKILAREMRRAALVGRLGLSGEKNVTGDSQKKLDIFGNETVVEAFAETGLVAAIVSEELDEPKRVSGGREAKYVLCVDPLDGSSNTDINGAVGTIFGIYRRITSGDQETTEDLLRRGSEQVAAGYVMYGPSAALVYTAGSGVNGFTLDHDIGDFLLSHENIQCPAHGHYYSGNLGNYHDWHPGVQKFIEYLTQRDAATRRPYSLRYAGALVADFHRSLLEGGIYIYPPDTKHKDGKLRLLYECAPLAFLAEQAGGRATTGTERILDIKAESIHQRVPLIIGSAEEVELYERFMRE
ncbi:MAG: class 1 fructose-bisphosphatase [Deltaproteobacteria bacterium]